MYLVLEYTSLQQHTLLIFFITILAITFLLYRLVLAFHIQIKSWIRLLRQKPFQSNKKLEKRKELFYYYKWEQLSAYECGFEMFTEARINFEIHFYLVAILFLIFDIEVAYLIAWAMSLTLLSGTALMIMLAFLVLLIIGVLFEWQKGALNWLPTQL